MTITGTFATRVVRVDGRRLSPTRSLRVYNHSPTGFNWGYGGSGPAQLALALLLHAKVPTREAISLHQRFKWEVISPLPQDDFAIECDIAAWVAQHHT